MPTHQDESIVERRQKTPLAPLDVSSTPKCSSRPRRAQMEGVGAQVSPLSITHCSESGNTNRPVSSAYSTEANQLSPPRPLNLRHSRIIRQKTDADDTVIDIYNNWANIYSSGISPETSPNRHSVSQYPRRSKSTVEGLRLQTRQPEAPPLPDLTRGVRGPPTSDIESPLFSPLALYFRGHDFPTIKKGEKTLIGDNGWLERTGQPMEKLDQDKKTPQKKSGLLDSIKKIAKDIVSLSI